MENNSEILFPEIPDEILDAYFICNYNSKEELCKRWDQEISLLYILLDELCLSNTMRCVRIDKAKRTFYVEFTDGRASLTCRRDNKIWQISFIGNPNFPKYIYYCEKKLEQPTPPSIRTFSVRSLYSQKKCAKYGLNFSAYSIYTKDAMGRLMSYFSKMPKNFF